MIRLTVLTKLLWIGLLCFAFTAGWAAPADKTVVVEIDTTEMSEDAIENVISEPIEILLGSLDDVLLVSARYRTNRATINVRFLEVSADPEVLVARVKTTIDNYIDKLPSNSIDSISVSLGERVEANIPETPETPKAPNRVRAVEKRDMTGRYLGSIESSNEYLPVITTIAKIGVKSGLATGQYFMSEQDAIIIGELSGCANNSGNVLTCQWRDQYGKGGVDFVFTADYASFSGRWSVNGQEGAYKWSGIKIKDN